MVYIYGLRCPLTGQIRYIGKSVNPKARTKAHIYSAVRGDYNHHAARWLRKLAKRGLAPEVCTLRTLADGERWQDIEREAIADALKSGARLTNSTAGGEGLDYVRADDRERYLRNLSASLKALWNRPERKAEASARSRKAWADEVVTAKRITSMRRAQNDPELKARLAEIKRVVSKRPEVKASRSAKMKDRWADPTFRDACLRRLQSSEFKQKQAERLKARWGDTAHREKMMASLWSPERRREQAKTILSPDRQAKIKLASDRNMIDRRNAAIKASWAKRRAAGKRK